MLGDDFDYAVYLKDDGKPGLLSLSKLRYALFYINEVHEHLGFARREYLNFQRIPYVAMMMYHVTLKRLLDENSTNELPKFDIKMLLMACLRISAVVHDIEVKQHEYTRVYYESIVSENRALGDIKAMKLNLEVKEDKANIR